MLKRIAGLLTALGLAAQFVAGQLNPDCNPLETTCPPNKAWPEKNYFIDFTKETKPPPNWVIANYEVVNFTPNGAEFPYTKRKNAPNMWTDFYMLGGRYDVEMKIAPGQGIVSSAVLWSDVQDEIDYEFSGNQFGDKPFPPPDGMETVETNIFTHGKIWNGAATYQKDAYKPSEQFHTYSVEWDEDHINWYVDNKLIRGFLAKDTPQGFVFPSSPMKLQIGLWGGGDPENNYWTIQWAGGDIDFNGMPYTAYVKSVNITNKYPACQYRYKDKSGTFDSIERIQDGCNPLDTSSATTSTSPKIVKNEPTPEPSTSDDAMSMSTSTLSSSSATDADSSSSSSTQSASTSAASSSLSSPASPDTSSTSSGGILSSLSSYILGTSSTTPATSSTPTGTMSSTNQSSSGSSTDAAPKTTIPTISVSSSASSTGIQANSSSASVSATGSASSSTSLVSSSENISATGNFSTTAVTNATASSGSVITTSSISTVYSTNIYTVTSCPPTVTNCPTGKVTTELVSVTTTVCPVTSTIGVDKPDTTSSSSVPTSPPSSLPSSMPLNTSSAAAVASSSLSSVISSFSSVVATPSTNITLNSTRVTSVRPIQLLPTSYSESSRVITSTLSTVYSTNIITVTSCAPTVTNCPVGKVTTEVVSLYTTICPVTKDIIDGTTYTQIESTSTSPMPSSSSSSLASSANYPVPTSSSAPSTLPPSAGTSLVAPSSSGPFINNTVPTSGSSSVMPTMIASNSSIVPTTPPPMTTSTVYSTNIFTVTSCPPEVTNCPTGQVTTELVSLYTTICPVEQVQTTTKSSIEAAPVPGKSSEVILQSTPIPTTSRVVASSATLPGSTTSAPSAVPTTPSYTTSTVYSTNVYTVTSCAPEVTNCPASIGKVTTEIVAISTTVCPVTEKAPKESAPPASYSTTVVTFSNTFGSSVVVVTSLISFVDTPAPVSPPPTYPPGTANTAGTSAVAAGSTGSYRNTSKPCTTLTLGQYFTTVIEYDSITSGPPATVTTGSSIATSIYSQPAAPTKPPMDVPSYQMSQGDSTIEMGTFQPAPGTTPAPSLSSAAPTAIQQKVPESSPAREPDSTTTLTKAITSQQTVSATRPGQSQPPPGSSGACICEPATVSVTVTAAGVTETATVIVTSTVQPPYPTNSNSSRNSAGTGSSGYYGTGTGTGSSSRYYGTGSGSSSSSSSSRSSETGSSSRSSSTGMAPTSMYSTSAPPTTTTLGGDNGATTTPSTTTISAEMPMRRWFRRGYYGRGGQHRHG